MFEPTSMTPRRMGRAYARGTSAAAATKAVPGSSGVRGCPDSHQDPQGANVDPPETRSDGGTWHPVNGCSEIMIYYAD